MNKILKFLSAKDKLLTRKLSSFKLINKNPFLAIPIFYTILFLIEKLKFLDLYNEPYVRRLINMYRRRDPLTYEKRLNPFCQKYEKMIGDEHIKKLQSIKLHSDPDMPWISRTNTTTIYYKDFSEKEKKYVDEVKEIVRKRYEEKIGKKLYDIKNGTTNIYVYHGKNSKHLWHVDPQNVNTIYNCILCIKREGNISPLECKDKTKNVHAVHFQPGDAAIFNGGTTIHQVPPNDDPNSKRTVLSIAFTSEKKLVLKNKEGEFDGKNMCTYIEGGANVWNLFKMWFGVFFITLILSKISNVSLLSNKFLLGYMLLLFIIVKFLPLHFNTGLGTGRPSSIFHNIILSFLFMLTTLNPKGGLIFFSYFALSDQFFPSSWVAYD
tara:strand:- start:1068 stop:2204 length:1137 start_codon:yes stop_codon:yes gene_type:complete